MAFQCPVSTFVTFLSTNKFQSLVYDSGILIFMLWTSFLSSIASKHPTLLTHLIVLTMVRFVLERLGVVQAEDHTALVLEVFWR